MRIEKHIRKKAPQNSASAPVTNQFQSRPFAVQAQPEQSSPQQQEMPDLQAQRERAERLAYNFANIAVYAPGTPTPEPPKTPLIQKKLGIGSHGDKSQRQVVPVIPEIVSRILPLNNQRSGQGQGLQRQEEGSPQQ
jgi:hypothetical protein